MWREHYRDRPKALKVVLAALGIRLLAGWWLGHFVHPVAWEYEAIANHLLEGQGFVYEHLGTPYRAFTTPLYPLFCAAIYAITHHSHVTVLGLQCILGALACVQVHAIGRLVFRDSVLAAVGSWFVAFHPGLVVYASRLHPLTLDVGVFLWVVWAWLRLVREPTWPWAVGVGVSSGVALLSRATILPFLLLAMGWFLCHVRLPRAQAIKRLAVMATVAGLLISPWLVRNAMLFHRFPVFQTTANEVFWRGNNPHASGSSYLPDGQIVLRAASDDFHHHLAQLDELGQSRFFFQEAWRFVRTHPLEALKLYGKKWAAFWWFSQQTGLTYPSVYLQGYRAFYVPVLILALIGLWQVRRRLGHAEFLLVVAFVLSICAVQSLYYVEGRHRWTVEPLLLLFSAAGGLTLLRGAAWLKPLR